MKENNSKTSTRSSNEKKIKLYNQWNNIKKPSNPGREEYEEWGLNKEGKPIIIGTRNRYQEIQEAAEGITLNEIMNKYEQTGILEVPNNKDYEYGDETIFSDRPHIAANQIREASNITNQIEEYINQNKKPEPEPEPKPEPKPEQEKGEN